MLNRPYASVVKCMLVIIILIVCSFFLVACEPDSISEESPINPSQLENIVFTTNPPGTEYYTISVAQTEILKNYTDMNFTVQPSTGSVSQFEAVKTKQALFGMSTAQGMVDAWNGKNNFEEQGSQDWLRAVQIGSYTMFGFVTRADKNINSIPDLKGKNVTFKFPADNTARMAAIQQLKAFGLDPESDVNPLVAEFTQQGFKDLKEGKTDAAIGALKNPTLQEVATVSDVVLLPFPEDKISFVQDELKGMYPVITKGLPVIPDGIPAIGSPAVLYTHVDMPEAEVYEIIKTLIENYDELKSKNPSVLEDWSKENAVKELSVPYHPGAIKYFKEIGIWSDQMDELQAELLKK